MFENEPETGSKSLTLKKPAPSSGNFWIGDNFLTVEVDMASQESTTKDVKMLHFLTCHKVNFFHSFQDSSFSQCASSVGCIGSQVSLELAVFFAAAMAMFRKIQIIITFLKKHHLAEFRIC